MPWGKTKQNHVSEIQGTKSNPVAELCQAIRQPNLLNVNQPTPICTHAVASAKELPVVRKQLRVKLRLGDSSRLEMGLVDFGSGCNLLPLSYCKRFGLGVKRESGVTQLRGFNGSSSNVEG